MAVNRLCPFECFKKNSPIRFVLIQLNVPINDNIEAFHALWQKAVFKACVDGAVNQLYRCTHLDPAAHLPDLITGDFDSAEEKILEHYRSKNCEIIHTPDQDFNDFEKCLKLVIEKIEKQQLSVDCIVAYDGICGRLDHVMGNINVLFSALSYLDKPLYLVSKSSVTCLLRQGKNEIKVEKPNNECGLLPIGGPSHHVTTSGLVWNLSDQALMFGDLVSSSNKFDGSPVVHVETDQPLVWTMGTLFVDHILKASL